MTFSAYDPSGTADVCGVDLATKKVTNFTHAPDGYDEPEGIFPDGDSTLVECDRQNHKGPGYVDIWKLELDGSGQYERLTFFSDYPGYKASNPVVSDDGRCIAFQMGRAARQPASVTASSFTRWRESARTSRGSAPPRRRSRLLSAMASPNAFIGRPKAPNDADLTTALGPAKPVWDPIVVDMARELGWPIASGSPTAPSTGGRFA